MSTRPDPRPAWRRIARARADLASASPQSATAYRLAMKGVVRKSASLHARATDAASALYTRGAMEGDDDLCALALLMFDLRDATPSPTMP